MAAYAETLNQRASSKRRERLFYSGMTVAFVLTVFAGFSRTFYLRPYFVNRPLIPLLILHGLLFTSWLALFLTQTTLIAAKRIGTHRRLGIAGAVLAGLMIIIGTVTGIVRAKVFDVPPGTNPLTFLTVPLGDMFVFALVVGAAFYFRRRVDVHKRLMLLATITLLPAAVARLPIAFIEQASSPLVAFGLSDLFIVPLLIYDFVTRGRPHRATILGGALIVISHPLRLVVGNTHAWLAFATWITQWS
jgi:hypothetical protein